MLPCLVSVLLTFVLKFKKKKSVAKRLNNKDGLLGGFLSSVGVKGPNVLQKLAESVIMMTTFQVDAEMVRRKFRLG